ncbi:MAG TPA: alpha/beta hydrolase [Polyangiaceae bacterium]|jgi:pimeloyl-ACP methyl ester carboxylesterase
MKTTKSEDGTTLAYDELGAGPPLVLVDGAFCRRAFGPMPALAAELAKSFTVFHYDRRGRGDSGDTKPYAVEREVEDLAAVVAKATVGGAVFMYGISSGAALALRGAASGLPVKKLVVYEPPFMLDGKATPNPPDFRAQIDAMLAEGKRGEAVKLFMKVIGVPAAAIFFMRLMPNVWPKLRAVAHTLPYDFAVLGDSQTGKALPAELVEKLESIDAKTLSMAGSKSPEWMHHAAKKVAETIPGGAFRVVPGQDHNVSAKAMAPLLSEFFSTSS